MTHASFDTKFEIKFLAETGAFEGYASVFHVTDSVNDRVAPGAFRQSLARFHAEGRLPPLLWQHDTSEPIGAWREMYEDEHGLYVKGELFVTDIPLAREAMKLLKENVVTGLSIGYRAKSAHKDQKTGVRVLTEVDLHEVSLVTFPANEYARVSKIKRPFNAETPPSPREFESFLRASGLSRAQAKGILACGYKGLSQADDLEAAGLIALVNDATRAMKYSQNQPRVPAGNTEGGRWTDDGVASRTVGTIPGVTRGTGVSAGNVYDRDKSPYSKTFDRETAASYAVDHAKPKPPKPGEGECAAYVRKALEAGGVGFEKEDYRNSAKDYGDTLEKYGFDVIALASAKSGSYPPFKGFEPEEGDVVVIQATSKNPHGHMAIYVRKEGTQGLWVSDFKQKGFWPGQRYLVEKPSYKIYRRQY